MANRVFSGYQARDGTLGRDVAINLLPTLAPHEFEFTTPSTFRIAQTPRPHRKLDSLVQAGGRDRICDTFVM